MNTCKTAPSLQARLVPARPAARGPLASLQQLINTAGMVSVDLTDTIFATMPRRDGAPREAVVKADEQSAA